MSKVITTLLALVLSVSSWAGSIVLSRTIDARDTATDYTLVEADFRGTTPSRFFRMERGVDSIIVDIPFSSCVKYWFLNIDRDTSVEAEPVVTPEYKVYNGKRLVCLAPPTI